MQPAATVMDWRQRILFFLGTIAVLFAVAMLSGFTMQWWWWEFSFLAVGCVCVAFMRQRLIMLGAIGLIVATRLLIALAVYFLSLRHITR
jgi:hypothetical protein